MTKTRSEAANARNRSTVERVTLTSKQGKAVTVPVRRDSKSGRFLTTERSARRLRDTSVRAADSLKRLAER